MLNQSEAKKGTKETSGKAPFLIWHLTIPEVPLLGSYI